MPVVRDEVRKLATVETISTIAPIPDADAIVAAKVRGWTVVVKKDEFREGDKVVYFEEDTALPLDDERFAFLAPRGAKEDGGRLYHVLKIAKLRGVYSQGMVLPFNAFVTEAELVCATAPGTDLTGVLGLGKWEAPLPTGNGEACGKFLTSFAAKTDSERVQNISEADYEALRTLTWKATEKVDGQSNTVVRDLEGNLRVMSRNWEIRDGDNTGWNLVRRYASLFEALAPGEAIQFEAVGPGIQGNRLGLKDVRPVVFDVVRNRQPLPREQWPAQALALAAPTYDLELPDTKEELVALVDGIKSLVNPGRLAEGVVFHTTDGQQLEATGGRSTFKVISNKYLLKS